VVLFISSIGGVDGILHRYRFRVRRLVRHTEQDKQPAFALTTTKRQSGLETTGKRSKTPAKAATNATLLSSFPVS
jgi:hypothetical protein